MEYLPAPTLSDVRKRSGAEGALAPEAVEVSIVMPCLNEARTVAVCIHKALDALRRLEVRGEVVIADNGSTDRSAEFARAAGARVVRVRRRGYGNALRGGIQAARGRYIIMGDSDDSYDFGQIEPFLQQLRAGYDLVMGNRFRGGIQPGAMPWLHRYLGNPVLTGLLNLFYRSPIGDAHCGLRAFRRDSYFRLGLSSSGMEFASEMVVQACLRRQRITEVPTSLYPDGRDRPPHLRSFRDGWRHLRFLLLLRPVWLFLGPAAFLLLLGLALLVYSGWQKEMGGLAAVGVSGSALVLSGYQIFWLWGLATLSTSAAGLIPKDCLGRRLWRRLTLERSLLGGAVLSLACLLSAAGLCWNPPPAHGLAVAALWGATALGIGILTLGNGFFLALLRLACAHRRVGCRRRGLMREARLTLPATREAAGQSALPSPYGDPG